MANDEFVDLDDIVPGTGFRRRPDEQVAKKEVSKPQETPPQEKPEQKQPKPEKQTAQKILDSSDEPIEETIALPKAEPSRAEPKPEAKAQKKAESQRTEPKSESKIETKSAPVKKESPKKAVPEKSELKEKSKPVEKKQPVKLPVKLPEKKHAEPKKVVHAKPAKQEKKAKVKPIRQTINKDTNGRQTNWTMIALLIFAAIVIAVVIYMILKVDFTSSNTESVVAVVNGQPIYKSELSNKLNLLRTTISPLVTEEQALNLTITDELLLQEAERQGIRTTDNEVRELLDELMIANNIDDDSLRQDLLLKNVSYDFFFGMYRNTLTINKLVEASFGNITITQEEIEAFYEENKATLKVPDMVQVRHILFAYGDEGENETFGEADFVFDQIQDDKSNFCALAAEYSDDTTDIESCGEYNFSTENSFVPEFIIAGFEMSPGDVKIIKTQIGYHIMYKVANIPGYVPELENLQESIVPVLEQEKTMIGLQELIDHLKDNAIIEIYNDNISTKRFKEVTAAPATETEENTTNSQETETQAEPEQETAESPAEITELTETPYEQVEVTKEIVVTPSSQKFMLAKCLSDSGSRMFTTSWSPDSRAQLELFGEYAENLNLVECDPENADAQIAECDRVLLKKYPTWPTWQINGNLYEGIQSLSALSRISACPYSD